MRKNFLLIATISLLAAGCKKETKELTTAEAIQSTTDRSAQSAIGTGCYGNNWTYGDAFTGNNSSPWPALVYNNKAYIFNTPSAGIISILDGSTCTFKNTNIPASYQPVDFAFVIGNKGYMGYTYGFDKQCYEYDFDANTWTYKANYPGLDREYEAYFSIGNKGYIVGGYQPGSSAGGGNLFYYTDTWEFDPASNSWTQKAFLPPFTFGRVNAAGFTIGNKGYMVGGHRFISPNYQTYFSSLLQYDPTTDTWTYKAYFPGTARSDCQKFVISGMGYVGGGYSSDMQNIYTYHKDFYKYNPSTDTWTQIPLIPGLGLMRQSFAINSRGYVAHDNISPPNSIMEKYTPLICGIGNPGPQ